MLGSESFPYTGVREIEPIGAENPLRRLDVSRNLLRELNKQTFIKLTNLLHVRLNNNLIRVIVEFLFRKNTKLIEIDLSNNKIVEFRFNLEALPELTYLDISTNRLTTLPKNTFMKYVKRNDTATDRHLNVFNNEFNCNCTMVWLRNRHVINLNLTLNGKCLGSLAKYSSLRCFVYNKIDPLWDMSDKCRTVNTTSCVIGLL